MNRRADLLVGVVTSALLCCVGCTGGSSSVVEFATPRVYLHFFRSPEDLGADLRADGPEIRTREELGNANADIVVAGMGMVYCGGRAITVRDNEIVIDGVRIDSVPDGYRNVTIARNGRIDKDRFIPFEPLWGYHPRSLFWDKE
jgi:hypothetical protein